MSNLRIALFAALVTISACGGGSDYQAPTAPTPPTTPAPAPAPPPSGGGSSVTIGQGATTQGGSAFGSPLTVAVGTRVTWQNNDSVPHTATSNASGVFDTGNIAPGASASVTFSTAGTIAYHCTIHPGMMGQILVQ